VQEEAEEAPTSQPAQTTQLAPTLRCRSAHPGTDRLEEGRAHLHERLLACRTEIDSALVARIFSISPPAEIADPAYLDGLRESLATSVEHAFAALRLGERRAPAPPTALLAQARLAARQGIALDTVLRRYFAGYALLNEFVIREAEDGGLIEDGSLQQLLFGQAAVFDVLIAAVSEEHRRELARRPRSSEERRAERIDRLLAGELIDASDLAYDLGAHHLAMIARGPGATEVIRKLASRLDRRLLVVRREQNLLWAWLGGRRPLDPEDVIPLLTATCPQHLSLALGEPGTGLGGWRLSHCQARAALQIALRSLEPFVRYADVALFASMLQDDLLVQSLRQLYLTPLNQERDGGEVLRRTLRAYFNADRNASSTATSLGVSRNTVASRLRAIETRTRRPLSTSAPDLEAALRLSELTGISHSDPPSTLHTIGASPEHITL
jgi:hypothetical protein